MPSRSDSPEGFLYSAASAGIRYMDRNDVALIFSVRDATVAGVFTRNRVKAAPVLVDMKRIRRGTGRAIFVNSGNANACTGEKGMQDAERICRTVAEGLSVSPQEVYIASTGVIGERLPMDRVIPAVKRLIEGLGSASVQDVAEAIMTTDRFPKVFSKIIDTGRVSGTLTGICKGAGMIHPQMATMLCFLLTDLAVEKRTLRRALRDAVSETFNLTTVDGDTSTNDTVLIMANGNRGDALIQEGTRPYSAFREGLIEVCDTLARMIARDGEGATKLILVEVKGASSRKEAERVAFALAHSPLVKTALYGGDPNWGRIMAAVGRASLKVAPDLVEVRINGVPLVKRGVGTGREEEVSRIISGSETVHLQIHLHSGKSGVRVYTCDLTEEYIRINARYRT